jgi:hypothetical protein
MRPAGEDDFQSLHHLTADDHRLCQLVVPSAAPGWFGEDLLGRDVRHIGEAVRVGYGASGPPAVRHKPDRQIRTGAAVADLGQLQRVHRSRPVLVGENGGDVLAGHAVRVSLGDMLKRSG